MQGPPAPALAGAPLPNQQAQQLPPLPQQQQVQQLQQMAPQMGLGTNEVDPLAQMHQYRAQLASDCVKVEEMIASQELAYLQAEFSQAGTVLKGYEGFLSSKEALRKRARNWKIEDRLFSLSSKTSPVTRELEAEEAMEIMQPGGFGKKGYAAKGYASKGKGQR